MSQIIAELIETFLKAVKLFVKFTETAEIFSQHSVQLSLNDSVEDTNRKPGWFSSGDALFSTLIVCFSDLLPTSMLRNDQDS